MMCLNFIICSETYAAQETDYSDIYDFSEIEEVLDKNSYDMSFSETVRELSGGNSKGIFYNMFMGFVNELTGELIYNKEVVIKVILMAISLALLNNLSAAFSNSRISETGFFIIYCMIITILMSGFMTLSQMIITVLDQLLKFMSALIPAFFLAMGIAGGYTSQGGFCQIILVTITAVEFIMKNIVVPAINMYVVLMLVNSLVNEDYVSKFAGLLESVVSWVIKTLLTVVTGLNLIQSMILPAIDSAGTGRIRKLAGLIPGVSAGTDAVSEIIMGTGNVIKNAMGGATLIFIIIIIAFPVVKTLAFIFMYKVAAAVVQPVSDKRVICAIESVSRGATLLYRTIIACGILFALSIAIMCISTNIIK